MKIGLWGQRVGYDRDVLPSKRPHALLAGVFSRRQPISMLVLVPALLAGAATLRPQPVMAQQGADDTRSGALRVFFDCSTRNCDRTRYRTDIQFVSWVRNREDAQVHVIMTGQRTGGGGFQYQLDFVGLDTLEGSDDQLLYVANSTDTQEEALRGISRTLAVGLARYASLAGVAERIQITTAGGETEGGGEADAGAPEEDPWNLWVFDMGFNGFQNGEERQNFFFGSAELSANRTSEEWKLDVELDGSLVRQEFELEEGEREILQNTNWEVSALAVKSIAEHWSAGVNLGAAGATFTNQELSARFASALEYSYWAYEEATRKQLLVLYELGLNHFRYEEITVFDKTEETRLRESLTLSVFQRETWGQTRVSLQGRHFFHDLRKYSATLSGNMNVRIFRGFTVRFGGSGSLIRDRIFIAREGATTEDILTQRRALETGYSYFFNFGIGYSFGSTYNNVVNNRFSRGGFFF